MKLIKIYTLISLIISILVCLGLIWNENSVKCDDLTCKIVETMFFIISLKLIGIYKEISWDK